VPKERKLLPKGLCHVKTARAGASSVHTAGWELGSDPAMPLLHPGSNKLWWDNWCLGEFGPLVTNATHCVPGSSAPKLCPAIY